MRRSFDSSSSSSLSFFSFHFSRESSEAISKRVFLLFFEKFTDFSRICLSSFLIGKRNFTWQLIDTYSIEKIHKPSFVYHDTQRRNFRQFASLHLSTKPVNKLSSNPGEKSIVALPSSSSSEVMIFHLFSKFNKSGSY